MDDKMILGAWLTEEDVAEICDDLGIDLQDALDKLSDSELQSELNTYLIEMVWEELKEDEDV